MTPRRIRSAFAAPTGFVAAVTRPKLAPSAPVVAIPTGARAADTHVPLPLAA